MNEFVALCLWKFRLGKKSAQFILLLACAGFLLGCNVSTNQDLAVDLSAKEQGGAWKVVASAPDSGSAPATAGQTFASSTPGSSAYKIGPLDVLEISVFKVPELSTTVQVADVGTVSLPLVGDIPAAGLTAQDVERGLTKKLGEKYLKSPQVTVFVKEYNSQRITVEGAVKKPGVFAIKDTTSLLQSIAMAGGFDQSSYDSTVLVFRQTGEEHSAARFDIDQIKSGQVQDPILQQGDVVVVHSSALKDAFNSVLKILPIGGMFIPLLL